MPSVSQKQHNYMEGIAHGMKPRSGKGPSKAVAEEFVKADAGRSSTVAKRHKNNKRRFEPDAVSRPSKDAGDY